MMKKKKLVGTHKLNFNSRSNQVKWDRKGGGVESDIHRQAIFLWNEKEKNEEFRHLAMK